MLLMLGVIVALSLLGITFGIMFVVTITGTSPPQGSPHSNTQCVICESDHETSHIHSSPVCDTCEENLFSDL